MWTYIVAAIAIVWPPVAAWLGMKLFPGALTKFIDKEIERRSDIKLERVKADLQGSYSTLKTSVDVLASTNSGMHPHIIGAVTALWAQMMRMRDKFATMVAFDAISLAEEAEEAFAGRQYLNLLEYVRPLAGEMHQNPLCSEFNSNAMDEHRLFTGDRLWLFFGIFRALYLRNALLLSQSFERGHFVDWRHDNGVKQLLRAVLTEEETNAIRAMNAGGVAAAIARVEIGFLHEATRVMSGSKAMADSLSDMQSIMLLQNATIGRPR